MNANTYSYGTGKRKTSIARVFIKKGTGITLINNSTNYFKKAEKAFNIINKPLHLLNLINKLDLKITVKGGGITGQTDAIKLGLCRALVELDSQNQEEKNQTFKKDLRKIGYLTRDSRKIERKKVGRRKARKKEQYSKR